MTGKTSSPLRPSPKAVVEFISEMIRQGGPSKSGSTTSWLAFCRGGEVDPGVIPEEPGIQSSRHVRVERTGLEAANMFWLFTPDKEPYGVGLRFWHHEGDRPSRAWDDLKELVQQATGVALAVERSAEGHEMTISRIENGILEMFFDPEELPQWPALRGVQINLTYLASMPSR